MPPGKQPIRYWQIKNSEMPPGAEPDNQIVHSITMDDVISAYSELANNQGMDRWEDLAPEDQEQMVRTVENAFPDSNSIYNLTYQALKESVTKGNRGQPCLAGDVPGPVKPGNRAEPA